MINPSNNIFLWNCRGAASSSFHRFCKQYLDVHHPDVVVVMETIVDPLKLQRTFGLLGFDGFLSTDVQGYAGGIVVVWKTAQLHITLLRREFQFLHLRVNMGNMAEWFFTPIYASPNEEARRGLWADLRRLSSSVQSPWLLAGDFNDIAHSGEKKGGPRCPNENAMSLSKILMRATYLILGRLVRSFRGEVPSLMVGVAYMRD